MGKARARQPGDGSAQRGGWVRVTSPSSSTKEPNLTSTERRGGSACGPGCVTVGETTSDLIRLGTDLAPNASSGKRAERPSKDVKHLRGCRGGAQNEVNELSQSS